MSWALWLNAALNSILVAPELAFPRGRTRIVQEETRWASRLSVPTCVTFSEDRQGWLLLAGHPLLGFPRVLLGWWIDTVPICLAHAASPRDREDHWHPAVFLSRNTTSILARAMLYLTTWTVPHYRAFTVVTTSPQRPAIVIMKTRITTKHCQKPPGLQHSVSLRTMAVFTDEAHLYKYSVFPPDKNNYCPYWSIWYSIKEPSLK